MPNKHYIPRDETGLVAWSGRLAQRLLASGSEYGVAAEEAAEFGAVQGEFVAAWTRAQSPVTRTKPLVTLKNAKKAAMLAVVRPMVQRIQNWPGMTDGKRAVLGTTVRRKAGAGRRIGRPTEPPVLAVASARGRVFRLRVSRDGGEVGRPAGVAGLWMYRYVGERMPESLADYEFVGASSSTRPEVVMPPGTPVDAKVWLSAAWINPRQEVGPMCQPVVTWTNRLVLDEAEVGVV